MVLCELKSSFDTSDINKARDQIIGTFQKLKGILGIIEGFNLSEYKTIGVIASFMATDEQLNSLSSREDVDIAFAVRLNNEKKVTIPAIKSRRLYSPLKTDDFELCYLPIPKKCTSFVVDINTLIS